MVVKNKIVNLMLKKRMIGKIRKSHPKLKSNHSKRQSLFKAIFHRETKKKQDELYPGGQTRRP